MVASMTSASSRFCLRAVMVSDFGMSGASSENFPDRAVKTPDESQGTLPLLESWSS